MRSRLLILLAALAVAAPALAMAQTRKAPVIAARDTHAVALVPEDTIAAGEVDSVVRARHREVQFCFEESGLKTDPELSGTFAMMLTLDTLGRVAQVNATRQEWSGPDGTAVEACVMERARTWKFPARVAVAAPRHEVTFRFSR
jgi:hypothetical protein